MEKKIRRDENLMNVLGKAIIVFGLVSVLKLIIVLLSDDDIIEYFKKGTITTIAIIMVIIAIILIAALEMIIRIYIGISAIKEAQGIKRSSAYLVLCAIFTVITLFLIVYSVIQLFQDENYILNFLAGFLLDVTSAAISVMVFITSIKVRVRRKKLGKVE